MKRKIEALPHVTYEKDLEERKIPAEKYRQNQNCSTQKHHAVLSYYKKE